MKISKYVHKMNAADKLIVLSMLLFVLTQLAVYTGTFNQQELNSWLCVPPNVQWLLQRPWVLLTYAFYHVGLEHLLGNMLFLFLIGRIFFRTYKLQQFLIVYFLGVLAGSLTFLGLGYFFPHWVGNAMLLGASAAIMAVLAFVVAQNPLYGVYIFTYRIKIVYVLLVIILFDLVNFSLNSGGKIAHWGGVLVGILVGLAYKYRNIVFKVQKTSINTIENTQETQLEEQKKIKQHKIKQLFDKISASGYASLTDEEKKYLFQASKDS